MLQRNGGGLVGDVISRSMYWCGLISVEPIKSNLRIIKSFIMAKITFCCCCCMVLVGMAMEREV